MDNPAGTIRSVYATPAGQRVAVEVDGGVVCARCASGKGCGAGLLGSRRTGGVIEAVVGPEAALAVGDKVRLHLAGTNLLAAAWLAYGLPLGGALAGAALAFIMRLGDPAAAGFAIAGLLVGLAAGRWRLQRADCLQNFVPYADKRL